MGASDADAVRAEILERWGRAAAGWSKRARQVREFGLPVSAWMLDHAGLQPGLRVLELAAGPGETGFLAAELIRPGGSLVCSDATEEMLDVARARAKELGIENVAFKRIELEWIDLDTASVDVVLCKWGLMFSTDPEASLREVRRVLRPGGRVALAVWDEPPENPWATIPTRALVELGHTTPLDPDAPGMFAFADPDRVRGLLAKAGWDVTEITSLRPSIQIGGSPSLDEAVDFLRTGSLGRAVLASVDPQTEERAVGSVRAALRRYSDSDGVRLSAAVWVVKATS